MRILITEFIDEPTAALLASRHDTLYDPTSSERRDELLAEVAGVDALIVRNRTRVDRELLDAAPRLRVLGRLGVGLDNIDVAECAARGIEVIPAIGANALAVAEYVIAAAMLLLRGAYRSSEAVTVGAWPRAALAEGREIAGKTLGLVGFGSIGQRTARLARGVGMRVLGCDVQFPADAAIWTNAGVEPRSLDTLLAESDVVSLHVPLVPATRGLIDAEHIARMKDGAILVNTARGGVVDELALATALRAGRLGGAALDVFEQEPLPAGSALSDCPNLLLTPHVAGLTRESNQRVSSMIAERVLAALEAATEALRRSPRSSG
jgi:(S)-sulfolactate dehydrogenase